MKHLRWRIILFIGLFTLYPLVAQTTANTEKVVMSCLYHYNKKALNKNDTLIISDTVRLDIGNIYSRCYNSSYETNMQVGKEGDLISKMFSSSSSLQINLEENTVEGEEFDFNKSGDLKQTDSDFIFSSYYRPIGRIYKNRSTGEVITSTVDDEDFLKCIETDIMPQWEFVDETKEILGYTCLRAETQFRGRKYICWFTLDIPISDGPWKLYGLPGLILEAKEVNDLFTFTAIGLLQADIDVDPISLPDKSYIKTSLKKLKQLNKSLTENIRILNREDNKVSLKKWVNPIVQIPMELDDF